MTENNPTTLPRQQSVSTRRQQITIGVPASACRYEKRFPLTPEGVQTLAEKGFRIKIEEGASAPIHYSDADYSCHGAEMVSRAEALKCDIIIHPALLSAEDIRQMKRGAMLMSMLNLDKITPEYVAELNRQSIISIALDLVEDNSGNLQFADILNEVAGRAAMVLASAHLADSLKGKGILLGGVAGIIPCEVAIIGSGIAAIAAATSACGLGAIVKMFDDDIYSLRRAVRELGPQIIPSSQHPNVLNKALMSADVIILTQVSNAPLITADQTDRLKKGVITFDLSDNPGSAFPAMHSADCGVDSIETLTASKRVCYHHPANAVPRTAAMALSNSLVALFGQLYTDDGTTNALKLSPGLQAGTITYLGKVVNAKVAAVTGCRAQDISLFIQLS